MIAPNERAGALYSIRMTLGWSPADVAARLDVTPRTVGMWETGTQEMPDGRWRLFIHEVNAQLNLNDKTRSMVVVFAEDGMTPIDAIADSNFYSLERNDLTGTAVIAAYVIDRRTQQPHLHQVRFQQEGNEHVIRAAEKWEAALRAGVSTGEREMLTMHRWLTRRVLEVEQANPRLRELKNAIAAASEASELATTDAERREHLQALDDAVFALLDEVKRSREAL